MNLPARIAAIVDQIIADLSLDVTAPAAMAGECESVSRALAEALRDEGYRARVVMAWGVGDEPAALRDIADGAIVDGVRVYAYHYVTLVEVGAAESPDDAGYSGEWLIDLTAAQYRSTLGWDAPRAIFS